MKVRSIPNLYILFGFSEKKKFRENEEDYSYMSYLASL